jgi:cytidine deaminase
MGVIVTPEANDYLLEVVPPYLKTLAEKKSEGSAYKFSAAAVIQTPAGIWVASGVNLNLGYENICAERAVIAQAAKWGSAIPLLFVYGAGDMCGNCRQGWLEHSPWNAVAYSFDAITGKYKKGRLPKILPMPFLSKGRRKKHEQHNGNPQLLLNRRGARKAIKDLLASSTQLPYGLSVDILAQQAECAGKIGEPTVMTGLVYANRRYATGPRLEFGGGIITSSTMTALAEGVTVQGFQPIREIHLWGATAAFDQDPQIRKEALDLYQLIPRYYQRLTPLQSLKEAVKETADIPVFVYDRQGKLLFEGPLIDVGPMTDPFHELRQQKLDLIIQR